MMVIVNLPKKVQGDELVELLNKGIEEVYGPRGYIFCKEDKKEMYSFEQWQKEKENQEVQIRFVSPELENKFFKELIVKPYLSQEEQSEYAGRLMFVLCPNTFDKKESYDSIKIEMNATNSMVESQPKTLGIELDKDEKLLEKLIDQIYTALNSQEPKTT